MSGIAGIAQPGKQTEVERMIDKIAHRGPGGRKIVEIEGTTLGITWTVSQGTSPDVLLNKSLACDEAGTGHLAQAKATGGTRQLKRDPLGVAPLYYGKTHDDHLCFASEVKSLIEVTKHVFEVPPGHTYDGTRFEKYFELQKLSPLNDSPENTAKELRRRLSVSVEKNVNMDVVGSWLSGGLDSSTLAALARPHLKILHTFAAGLPGAPDLEYAREVAGFIKSKHHEIVVTLDQMVKTLPEVIYHLESFDTLLVRSSIINYFAAKLASDYVSDVFSGEGGDELFAGYEYLKALDPSLLADELVDITSRLHNTALQRVDRSASSHGTVAHTAFLDPDVVDFAVRIPTQYKIKDGIEKWILRMAINDSLPSRVLNRTKAKFWEGAGVGDIMAKYANDYVTTNDFNRQHILENGWKLDSKEELMYYRIFKEYYGSLEDLSWMGRTKK